MQNKQEPLLPADADFEPQTQEEAQPEPEEQATGQVLGDGDYQEQVQIELNTVMNNEEGEWVQVRVKGQDPGSVLADFLAMTHSLTAEFNIAMARPTPTTKSANKTPKEPATPKQPDKPQQSGQDSNGVLIREIEEIVVIKTKGKTQVQFMVQGFEWPVKDSRGGEVVAGYFDDDLGWTADHFQPGESYDKSDWQGRIYAHLEKPDRWWNITRVSGPVD